MRDALPEALFGQGNYVDRGCSVAPKCTACPLSRCRYDVPGGLRVILNVERDAMIRAAHANGEPAYLIASRLGLAVRTVHRAIRGS